MPDASMSPRWSRLETLIEDLKTADSITEAVQMLRLSARAIAGADGITFVQRDGDHVRYITEDAVGPLWTGQRFPIEACISGLAMTTREPIVIADVFADPRVPHAAYEITFVKSMAMFPLGEAGATAAIGAYWSRAGHIEEDTINLLSTLAEAAGAVLVSLGALAMSPSQGRDLLH